MREIHYMQAAKATVCEQARNNAIKLSLEHSMPSGYILKQDANKGYLRGVKYCTLFIENGVVNGKLCRQWLW